MTSLESSDAPVYEEVFHTYLGDAYAAPGEPRIVVVGKATAGWQGQGELSHDFVTKDVSVGRYSSHFWHFVRTLVGRVFAAQGLEIEPDEVFTKFAWSNVMRIARAGRNPIGRAYAEQKVICGELLANELAVLKPTCVVFVTGNHYWPDVQHVVGHSWDKLGPASGRVWRCRDAALPTSVFWTRHPQGWQSIEKHAAIEYIADACQRAAYGQH